MLHKRLAAFEGSSSTHKKVKKHHSQLLLSLYWILLPLFRITESGNKAHAWSKHQWLFEERLRDSRPRMFPLFPFSCIRCVRGPGPPRHCGLLSPISPWEGVGAHAVLVHQMQAIPFSV